MEEVHTKKIVDNLDKIHGKIGIAIRINVDKENQNEVQAVVDELKKKGIYEDVFCYLGLVTATNGSLLKLCMYVF